MTRGETRALRPADAHGVESLLRRLGALWKAPALADFHVSLNPRLSRTLGRLVGHPWRIELGPRALVSKKRLREVVTHEGVHAVLAMKAGPTHPAPHGPEWRELMALAGYPAASRAHWRCPSGAGQRRSSIAYDHWCPVCQSSRQARRPVKAWRCAACVAAGLDGTLEITRLDEEAGRDPMTTPAQCPFCFPAEDRIAFEDRLTRALWDAFPVSEGHLLIVPRRHVPDLVRRHRRGACGPHRRPPSTNPELDETIRGVWPGRCVDRGKRCSTDDEAEGGGRGMTRDWTTENWQIIRHVYKGWAEFQTGGLHNVRLPQRHFDALCLAARTKPFGRRPRSDDSLRNAIGNWLYSNRYGAWRNPNETKPYKGKEQGHVGRLCRPNRGSLSGFFSRVGGRAKRRLSQVPTSSPPESAIASPSRPTARRDNLVRLTGVPPSKSGPPEARVLFSAYDGNS